MSVELMARVWKIELPHNQQSILLAMADVADDNGRRCYPSHAYLAWKTGYSERQVSRIINDMIAAKLVRVIRLGTNNHPPHYHIQVENGIPKESYEAVRLRSRSLRGDNTSPQDKIRDDKLTPQNKARDDNLSPPGVTNARLGVTNATSRGDMVSPDPLSKHYKQEEEDDLPPPLVVDSARDTVHAAWRDQYGEDVPARLLTLIDGLTVECGAAAVIHAIVTSKANDGRNFKYLAECARNYLPPPPAASYALELPGVHRMEPPAVVEVASQPRELPPPLAHDDPWRICVAELCSEHPRFADWLSDSTLIATDAERDGKPVYRLAVVDPCGIEWLESMSGSIRRKLGSVLGKPVLVEVAATHPESESV